MRSFVLTGLAALIIAATAAHAGDTAAAPKTTKAAKAAPAKRKPQPMSDAKRRDLERRIEALEQKYEMQYRETDSPTGAPGAAPAGR
ncbi:MAG: hypothetical protein OZ922_17340 [Myxococcales bacterium]|jgi:formate-dependent nitrite reductase cytochrome c552 subunit|nr:hypothetical protein [Myxococcales bacterium]